MKRVKEACICQTLHFMLKEDTDHAYAVGLIQNEIRKYKASLEKGGGEYKILEETSQPDGSVIIRIIKQYSSAPVGSYFDKIN